MRRNRVSAFTVLLLAAVLASACSDRSRQPRSAKDGPAPIPVSKPTAVRWSEQIAEGEYATFQTLVKTMREGTTPASSIEAFEVLLANEPDRLERARQWCANLEGSQRLQALHMLYAELMLAETDVDILYECAKIDIEAAFTNASKNTISYGQYFSWGLSRPLQACLIAYDVTKQERFLDLVAESYERVLPVRDSELGRTDVLRGRAMHAWGTNKYGGEGRYTAEVTSATRISYPITRWMQIVSADPQLRAKHADRIEKYLKTVRLTIDDYEPEYRRIEGTDQGYYLHLPTGKAEPLNHIALAANCLLILHELTGEAKYDEMGRGIANFFKTSMWRDENDCLVWQYWPQPHDRRIDPVEHVWKGRTSIETPLFYQKRGVVFTEQDLKGICRTFLTNIYRGEGKWNKHIISKYSDFDTHANEPGGLLCTTPYIQLDVYEPRVREVIEEMVATRPDFGGWLNRSHAILAYAHRLTKPGFNANRTAESLYFPQRELR